MELVEDIVLFIKIGMNANHISRDSRAIKKVGALYAHNEYL